MLTGKLLLVRPVLRHGHLCIFKQWLVSRPWETSGTPIPRPLLCLPTWRWCSPSPSHKVIRLTLPPHKVSMLLPSDQGCWLSSTFDCSTMAPLPPHTNRLHRPDSLTSSHLKHIRSHGVGNTCCVMCPCTDTAPPTASFICHVSAQCLFLLKQRWCVLPPWRYKSSNKWAPLISAVSRH